MSIVKKISKNTLWLTISSVTSKVIGFGIVVLVARNLQVEGFGQYNFALSFGIIINVIANFGLSTLANRDLARDRRLTKEYINNIISIKLVLAAITLIFLTIIIQFIDKPFQVKVIVYLASVYVIVESYNIFFRSIFRAHERMHFETISRIIERLIVLTLVAGFFFMGYGIFSVFVAYIIAETVSMLITATIVYKKFCKFSFKFDFSKWKKFLKPSMYFALTEVFIIVYFKIDVLMLSIMKNDQVTGLYSSAYDLLFAFIFIPTIMNAAVFPRISFLAKNAYERFKNLAFTLQKYFLVVSIPLSIGLYFSSDFLIDLIYGSEFSNATALFQVMTIALIFVFLNHIYGSIFNAVDKQHIFTIFAGVCMVFNVTMNFILIPLLAAKGAAIATISTELLLTILSIMGIYKYIGKPLVNFWGTNAKILVGGIAAITVTVILPDFHPIIRSILSVLVYTTVIFTLRVFNTRDYKYFFELIQK
ncbi:flippase [Patescibacteria group bacterium]|nr:flippase [Patescibacteria group bacterium]MBU1074846.1 flippase [Patescibacteria group bacterium]MBU1951826.1 flippase [Patescibacteria group bacterium]